MRHFFLVDPLDKLYVDVDTSLSLAAVMKSMGKEVYLIFEKDLFFCNKLPVRFKAYEFHSVFDEAEYKNTEFSLRREQSFSWGAGDVLHMRLDPPFDSRYLRILWMLKSIRGLGVKVVNDPEGIILYNEKLYAYEQNESCPSLVGSSLGAFQVFAQAMKEDEYQALILKPLDLYQGKGVERVFFKDVSEEQLNELFLKKVEQAKGAVVVQPYMKEVEQGEIRATYFMGEELASVLKLPKEGDFMANMMSSRSRCKAIQLSPKQKELCDRIAKELALHGVQWIAFDLLGETVSEVNITCPGLIAESAKVHGRNLFKDMVQKAKW